MLLKNLIYNLTNFVFKKLLRYFFKGAGILKGRKKVIYQNKVINFYINYT